MNSFLAFIGLESWDAFSRLMIGLFMIGIMFAVLVAFALHGWG